MKNIELIKHLHTKLYSNEFKQLRMFSSLSQQNRLGRRVVVTGLGLVTPIGIGIETSWKNLLLGKSGVKKINHFDTSAFPAKIGAYIPVKNSPDSKIDVSNSEQNEIFDFEQWVPKATRSTASPFIAFALSAAQQAIEDSKYIPTEEEKDRTGVAIGAGMGYLEDITEVHSYLLNNTYRKISPYFIPRILINLAAGLVSIRYGYRGPNHSVSTACATGAHSIGDSYRFIRYGDADVMICGGTESCITPVALAGFSRAKALSTQFNESPEKSSRPFDKMRDGFVMGEGAGILVLEELEHAKKRGAKIYCEIKGYGLSGDAHHITAPRDDGGGAERSMRAAIRDSGIALEDIDYINAHATSTPLGDKIESKVIRRVFGKHADHVYVNSNKGNIGHLLGAAGAVESIFSILSLHKGIIAPTLNLESNDQDLDLNYVKKDVVYNKDLKNVLKNSFGFGGTNASLVFGKFNDS